MQLTHPTRPKVSPVESVDVAGSKLLFDDFSTNGANNLAYQLACEDQGARSMWNFITMPNV
jgi:hypothetical protein